MKSVLIIDEDAFTRNVFAQTLSNRGFTVKHAESGAEAMDVLADGTVDLVVVDTTLSDMDGASFVRALRSRDQACRVVVLSSVFTDELAVYEELTDELDVALVLHKPISPVEFCAQVETIFNLTVEAHWIPNEDVDGIGEAERARLAYRETIETHLTELERTISDIAAGHATFEIGKGSASLLRATASRYGFFAISRAAARIGESLETIESRGSVDDAEWTTVHDAMDDAFVAARTRTDAADITSGDETTVLVVDDDPDFLEQVRAAGRENMIRVVTAQSAAEVVDRIRDPSIDALLVDIELADSYDTFEFVRNMRERSGTKQKPLGFLAERGTLPDRVMAAHLGASVFVEKPIDSAQFADIVHRLVMTQHRGKRPVVVVVDRDPSFVQDISEMLAQAQMDPQHIGVSGELIDRIDDLGPDGLIVNVSMPGIGGFDLCRMVRAMPRWHDLPILLVGDRMDPETRIAAFRSGADDYLLKPPIREELLARLEVRIDRLRLLREQASTDLLTGLLSRRPFLQRFNARLSEARRSDRELALALLDLDGFKDINDTYGHLTGDRVLAALGRLLTNRFRMEDLRGRWGGEEFVVALIGEEAGTAEMVLQRILEEFRAMEFVGEHGERFSLTFSAGVAVFPHDAEEVRELLAVADERLYVAKGRGKNCIVA